MPGPGKTPAIVRHGVAAYLKVHPDAGTEKAFPIIVSSLQKAGFLKSGTMELTAAGEKREKEHLAEPDADEKQADYEKDLKAARKESNMSQDRDFAHLKQTVVGDRTTDLDPLPALDESTRRLMGIGPAYMPEGLKLAEDKRLKDGELTAILNVLVDAVKISGRYGGRRLYVYPAGYRINKGQGVIKLGMQNHVGDLLDFGSVFVDRDGTRDYNSIAEKGNLYPVELRQDVIDAMEAAFAKKFADRTTKALNSKAMKEESSGLDGATRRLMGLDPIYGTITEELRWRQDHVVATDTYRFDARQLPESIQKLVDLAPRHRPLTGDLSIVEDQELNDPPEYALKGALIKIGQMKNPDKKLAAQVAAYFKRHPKRLEGFNSAAKVLAFIKANEKEIRQDSNEEAKDEKDLEDEADECSCDGTCRECSAKSEELESSFAELFQMLDEDGVDIDEDAELEDVLDFMEGMIKTASLDERVNPGRVHQKKIAKKPMVPMSGDKPVVTPGYKMVFGKIVQLLKGGAKKAAGGVAETYHRALTKHHRDRAREAHHHNQAAGHAAHEAAGDTEAAFDDLVQETLRELGRAGWDVPSTTTHQELLNQLPDLLGERELAGLHLNLGKLVSLAEKLAETDEIDPELVEALNAVLAEPYDEAELELGEALSGAFTELEEAEVAFPQDLTVEDFIEWCERLEERGPDKAQTPQGFKMVFGKLLKLSKGAGSALKKGAQHVARGFHKAAAQYHWAAGQKAKKAKDHEKVKKHFSKAMSHFGKTTPAMAREAARLGLHAFDAMIEVGVEEGEDHWNPTKDGTTPAERKNKPVSCDPGQVMDKDTGRCHVRCTGGKIWNKKAGQCVSLTGRPSL